jgi:hypothetical protein
VGGPLPGRPLRCRVPPRARRSCAGRARRGRPSHLVDVVVPPPAVAGGVVAVAVGDGRVDRTEAAAQASQTCPAAAIAYLASSSRAALGRSTPFTSRDRGVILLRETGVARSFNRHGRGVSEGASDQSPAVRLGAPRARSAQVCRFAERSSRRG